MPTYAYRCKECQNTFEVFHSMNSTLPQYCPMCNGLGQKLLSASSIIFKGSGFYSTDYRDSGYIEAQKREMGSSSDSSKTSDKKSDSSTSSASSTSSSSSTTPPPSSSTSTAKEIAKAA